MDNNQILSQLKQLRVDDAETAFPTHKLCNDWADNVAPLLKFNPSYYNSFMHSLQYIRIKKLSAQTIMPHLHNMVGIVKQAIIELENNITSPSKITNKDKVLSPPEKVTLKWIGEHVPLKYYWSFALILVFVFGLGITFAQTSLYKSLTDKATAIINTNKNIEPTKQDNSNVNDIKKP